MNLPHTVTRSVLLPAAPVEVWEALTDESALREWLAAEVEIDPQAGGELLCRYEDGEERRGEVELVEEAERPEVWGARLGSLRLTLGRLVLA